MICAILQIALSQWGFLRRLEVGGAGEGAQAGAGLNGHDEEHDGLLSAGDAKSEDGAVADGDAGDAATDADHSRARSAAVWSRPATKYTAEHLEELRRKFPRPPSIVANEKGNPEERAGLISTVLFSYASPLIALGYRRPIEVDDLW